MDKTLLLFFVLVVIFGSIIIIYTIPQQVAEGGIAFPNPNSSVLKNYGMDTWAKVEPKVLVDLISFLMAAGLGGFFPVLLETA